MKKGKQKITPAKNEGGVSSTRQKILEVAGQVFAEKGFDRATSKEITELANTNAASVNYYFGSLEELYKAVLHEAASRLITTDSIRSATEEKSDPQTKLYAFVEVFVQALTSPISSSWVLRVISRELVHPTSVTASFKGKERVERIFILKSIVSELMGLPANHPAVERGCLSIIGPCFMLLICDRPSLQEMFPNLGFAQKDATALVKHLAEYALAGITSIANDIETKQLKK
ncbi:CerR family C-terminal domain-containing protein [Gimesia sp.]|uniref:TetR/AcrR family transcriptional regulator n=1 Tax=Gimesia sp. TaxID=2024833 RepID=UPI0032EC679E